MYVVNEYVIHLYLLLAVFRPDLQPRLRLGHHHPARVVEVYATRVVAGRAASTVRAGIGDWWQDDLLAITRTLFQWTGSIEIEASRHGGVASGCHGQVKQRGFARSAIGAWTGENVTRERDSMPALLIGELLLVPLHLDSSDKVGQNGRRGPLGCNEGCRVVLLQVTEPDEPGRSVDVQVEVESGKERILESIHFRQGDVRDLGEG